MKYIFIEKTSNSTHKRTSDGQLGMLIPLYDHSLIETNKPFVDTEDYVKITKNLPIEHLKKAKKANFSECRYNSEVSGIEINGMQILTDFNTQGKITAAYLMAYTDPTYTINWKTANGFVTLNAQQIMAIGTAIRNHVQAQFDKEMELLEQVDNATTIEELNSIVW